MVRGKLGRLERALATIRSAQCGHCGGRNGVGGVPLILSNGKHEGTDRTTYGSDRRCPRCGAEPPQVINIVTTEWGLYAEG